MKLDRTTVAFGRHQSFALRYSWLTKGYKALQINKNVFAGDDSTVTLGVGKNMVASIHYWLKACQIIDKTDEPTRIGKMLFDNGGFDPFLEDEATIWLLHWLLVNNPSQSTAIYWFFNKFHKPVFTTEELATSLSDYIRDKRLGKQPTPGTVKKDISLVTRMYSISKPTGRAPLEDSLDSPMASLGLLVKASDAKHFIAKTDDRESLPPLILGFSVLSLMKERGQNSLPLDDLMYSRDDFTAIGAAFRLSENALIKKLEELISLYPGIFEIRDTAGIYQLYLLQKNKDPEDMLREFYKPISHKGNAGVAA
jgi:hypothetical protein|tara:strand:- start:3090 stop:4019 length:930 start_codon:yes stop_codon:yes gene_type:complete